VRDEKGSVRARGTNAHGLIHSYSPAPSHSLLFHSFSKEFPVSLWQYSCKAVYTKKLGVTTKHSELQKTKKHFLTRQYKMCILGFYLSVFQCAWLRLLC
jgi:hypothetical protein